MARRKISNELWTALEPLIPEFTPSPKGGRRRTVDDRAALDGILYVLQTGIPWEELPQELGFGSGMTCWRRLRDLQAAGVWEQLHLFHGSAMSVIWKHMNDYLMRWMMRKYKSLARHKTRARHALGRLARRFPTAFVHWGMGCLPAVG